MHYSVQSFKGLGTRNAWIKVEHTRADANGFCVNYLLKRNNDEGCIAENLRLTIVNDVIRADCVDGTFTDFNGTRWSFLGENKNWKKDTAFMDGSPAYLFEDEKGRKIESRCGACNYDTIKRLFKALCPNRINDSNDLEQ